MPASVGGFGDWNASGGDMRPGSRSCAGWAPPNRAARTTTPSEATLVPALAARRRRRRRHRPRLRRCGARRVPHLRGAVFDIVGVNHGALLTGDMPLGLVIARLRHTGPPPPSDDDEPLTGRAVVRLEYAEIVADHDFGTKDDNVFDIYVDPDGGNDSYQYAGRIKHRRDAPFVKDWGDDGPVVDAVALPGTSPRMDVRIVVWEKDLWGAEPISIVTFADVTQSEDRDGLAYYEAVACPTTRAASTRSASASSASPASRETDGGGNGTSRCVVMGGAAVQDALDGHRRLPGRTRPSGREARQAVDARARRQHDRGAGVRPATSRRGRPPDRQASRRRRRWRMPRRPQPAACAARPGRTRVRPFSGHRPADQTGSPPARSSPNPLTISVNSSPEVLVHCHFR